MKSGKKNILLLTLLACYCQIHLAAGTPSQERQVAYQILHRLCRAVHIDTLQRPKIDLYESSLRNSHAYYEFQSLTIKVNLRVFRQLERWPIDQKESTLALLIGHELAHHIQHNNCKGQAYLIPQEEQLPTILQQELDADYQGIFTAFIAGYRIDRDLQQAIEFLLTHSETSDPAYPTKEERLAKSKTFINRADTAITYYQLGLALTEIHEWDLAIQCLEKVYEVYHGREVANLLAVCYMSLALEHLPTRYQQLAFPFETDPRIRLLFSIRTPPTRNATLREHYFSQAQNYLHAAKVEDPTYHPTYINSACLALMQQKSFDFILSSQAATQHGGKEIAKYLKVLNRLLSAQPDRQIEILQRELESNTWSKDTRRLLEATLESISPLPAPYLRQRARRWTLDHADRNFPTNDLEFTIWQVNAHFSLHKYQLPNSDVFVIPGQHLWLQIPIGNAPPLPILQHNKHFRADEALDNLGEYFSIKKTAYGHLYWYQEAGLLVWTDHHNAVSQWFLYYKGR